MAQVTLNWTPSPASSENQTIQYKLNSDTEWITFATVSPTTDSQVITELDDNKIYDFRIVNECSGGGEAPSPSVSKIWFACPVMTVTPSASTITYSFPHVGGDVNKYIVDLLSSSNALRGTKVHTSPSGTLTFTFTGLPFGTTYKIRVSMFAGAAFEFSHTCAPVTIVNTTAAESCSIPTGVSATMGADLT